MVVLIWWAVVLFACYKTVFLGAVLFKATLKYWKREKHLADLFLPNLSDEVNVCWYQQGLLQKLCSWLQCFKGISLFWANTQFSSRNRGKNRGDIVLQELLGRIFFLADSSRCLLMLKLLFICWESFWLTPFHLSSLLFLLILKMGYASSWLVFLCYYYRYRTWR